MTCEPIRDLEKIKDMKEALQMMQNGFRNRLLFEVGLATALRISDLIALTKADVKDGFVRIRTQKTGAYKYIELNPIVNRMIMAHIELLKDEDLLFPIKRGMAWKIIKKAADLAGLTNISTHSLRKTAAWHFYYQSGKDLAKTMNLLGHKEPRETLIYLQIQEDEVNQQLKNMYL
jgi:integrase